MSNNLIHGDAFCVDQPLIDIVLNCYIPNFRFIDRVYFDYPHAEIEFNLDQRYYTPDDRGVLSAANFVLLFNQSFLSCLYAALARGVLPVLSKDDWDPALRTMIDHVKILKIQNIVYRDVVLSSDSLIADLCFKKVLDRRRTNRLIHFFVDFSVCGGKHQGAFHVVLTGY